VGPSCTHFLPARRVSLPLIRGFMAGDYASEQCTISTGRYNALLTLRHQVPAANKPIKIRTNMYYMDETWSIPRIARLRFDSIQLQIMLFEDSNEQGIPLHALRVIVYDKRGKEVVDSGRFTLMGLESIEVSPDLKQQIAHIKQLNINCRLDDST